MPFDFLQPVETEVTRFINTLSEQHLGAKITLHTENSFPNLDNINVAILGISHNNQLEKEIGLEYFRKEFYKMYAGNWNGKFADIGNVVMGNSPKDTYFVLNQITAELLKKNIILIVIGGEQDLTYPLYRAYDKLDKMVNIVSVDQKFDFGDSNSIIDPNSYLSKIIVEKPTNLYNYTNIGYQTYFTSQEEIDLMHKMFFDSYRLGEIGADITIVEPVLRDADLVSLDLNSIQSSYTGNFYNFLPNGFTGREICAISRYAGISDRISVFGIFNLSGLHSEAVLIAQIVWYFLEGFTNRYKEYPNLNLENCTKYIVSFENNMDLIFYKSEISLRWWMEISQETNLEKENVKDKDKDKSTIFNRLLPCSEQDYQQALSGNYPQRWWKEQKKMYSIQ